MPNPHKTIGLLQRIKTLPNSSKYTQRMKMLSSKIFNHYEWPEVTKEQKWEPDLKPLLKWAQQRERERICVDRNRLRPLDLDNSRNWNYYPAHPQLRALSYTLRDYGLYRDEHLDFKEEMQRLDRIRGKQRRKPGGGKH